jgi:hypothetical protein
MVHVLSFHTIMCGYGWPSVKSVFGLLCHLRCRESSCTWKAAQTTFQTISHANLRSAFLIDCKLFDSIKRYTASTNRIMTSSSVCSCALLTAIQEASQVCATILSRTFSLVGCDTDHRAVQIDGTCPRSLLSDSANIVPGGPVTHRSNVGFPLILW